MNNIKYFRYIQIHYTEYFSTSDGLQDKDFKFETTNYRMWKNQLNRNEEVCE